MADGLENNVTEAKKEENNAKQKAFWEQIATHLRDFDEHLLFASANEPAVENAIANGSLNIRIIKLLLMLFVLLVVKMLFVLW